MSTTISLKPSPMEETFLDVENLIYHVCNLFQSKHGGDWDDLVSLANQVFIDAYDAWQDGLAPFTNFLSTCIYRRLLDEERKKRRLKTISISETATRQEIQLEARKESHFNFSEFTHSLSDDAKLLVSLVIETPAEIQEITQGKGGHPKNLRSTIRQHLLSLGWGYSRITESFEEIRAIL